MDGSISLWLLPALAAPVTGVSLWIKIRRLNFRPFCTKATGIRFLGLCLLSWVVDLAITLPSSAAASPYFSGMLGLAASGGYIFWSDKRQSKSKNKDQAALLRLTVSLGAEQLSRLYTDLSFARKERCAEIDETIRKAYDTKYPENGFPRAMREVCDFMESLADMYPNKDEKKARKSAVKAARDMGRKKSTLVYLIDVAYTWGIEGRILDKFRQ